MTEGRLQIFAPDGVAVDEHTSHAFVIDQSGQDDKGRTVYPSVHMLDTRTGAVLRTVALSTDPEGFAASGVAVDERAGRILVTRPMDVDVAGVVSILDATSGTILRTVKVDLDPEQVVVDERTGRAFIGGSVGTSGRMSLMDTRTETVVRTVRSDGWNGPVAVDGRTGRVFVLSAGGVAMVDGRTGVARRTVRVVGDPSDIAVGARTGRVFVATTFTAHGGRAKAPGIVTVLDSRTEAVLQASGP